MVKQVSPRRTRAALGAAAALLLALGSGARADEVRPTAAAPPALAPAEALLDQAHTLLIQASQRQDHAACAAVAPSVQAALQGNWSRRSFRVWGSPPGCMALVGGPWHQRKATAAEVQAALAPALAHFATMPDADRLADNVEVDLLLSYWNTLAHHGHGALEQADRLARVQGWIDRVRASPGDALAASYLTQLGRALYGQRWHLAWMQQLQQQVAQVLGPGHPATLHLLRARIFGHRQFEQPAQALALSDEYAALAARHQPTDERLAMLNRSERIGALAGVGRYGDAIDEGRQLMAWLQRQQPLPHGNIMRAAYNLMSVAMAMGDLEAAEAFARQSRETGLQADNSHDRQESAFAQLLWNQARTALGQPQAWQDLLNSLKAIQSWDLAGLESIHQLLQDARTRGDTATATWAQQLLEQVVHTASLPLQPARALPPALAAQAAAAGSAEGLQQASRALAIALAQAPQVRARVQVLPAFELARHAERLDGAAQAAAPAAGPGAIWLCKLAAQGLLQMRQGLPEEVPGLPLVWQREFATELHACIGRMIDAGRLTEAEQALQLLREEELHGFTRRSRGPAPKRNGAAAGLSWTGAEAARNAALEPIAAALRAQAAGVQQRAQAQSVPQERIRGADAQAAAAVEAAAEQLRALVQDPGTSAPGAHVTSAPGAHVTSAAGASRALPPGRARLTYWLGPDHASALLQVGRQHLRVRLPASTAQINRAVHALRSELARPAPAVPLPAQELHRWLVQPLQPWLRTVRKLELVPDGALRYLPFAALHDGQRYLVQRHVLAVELAAPARTAARPVHPAASRQTPGPQLVAFGRSQPDRDHAALPGVRAEMAALAALRGLRVRPAEDAGFTRDALRRALEAQPQLVHLASHFVLDVAGEEASYLLLGDGQRMPLRELRQLPWRGVHLALLSACDTGVALAAPVQATAAGASNSSGAEWAGFAAALRMAGVPHVLATLWRIEDVSAAQWVQLFFQPWQRAPAARARVAALPDAARLAATQRAWLQQHRGTIWAHPYHWAGFQWIGGL